jgi:hypothetical protein
MENKYENNTFVDIGMKEARDIVGTTATAVSRPGIILYERIKPLLLEVIGNNIIRPLMSPRQRRFN